MIKFLTALLLILGPISATAVVEVTNQVEHQAVTNQVKPVIIMFGAEWCPYCKEAMPAFIKAEKLYKGKVIFVYMDVDKVQIEGIPYLPSYVTSFITGEFNNESLNKLKSRDVKGLVEYIEKYHGVKP